MADVQAGEGLAGKLLKDEEMAVKMSEIVTDLSVTSSNLNRLGLWRVLFPKHPAASTSSSRDKRKAPPGERLPSPKDELRR